MSKKNKSKNKRFNKQTSYKNSKKILSSNSFKTKKENQIINIDTDKIILEAMKSVENYESSYGKKVNSIDYIQLKSIISKIIKHFSILKNKKQGPSEKINLKFPHILGLGKRGIVFLIKIDKDTFALKVKRIGNQKGLCSEAETISLISKDLGELTFVPQIITHDFDFILMSFIKGIKFEDFIKENTNNPLDILEVIYTVIDELFYLDLLRIDKGEMNHPQKHILVSKVSKRNKTIPTLRNNINNTERKLLLLKILFLNSLRCSVSSGFNVNMIDFERAKIVNKPKNLTQFISYLSSNNITQLLKEARITYNTRALVEEMKQYKNLMIKFIESQGSKNSIEIQRDNRHSQDKLLNRLLLKQSYNHSLESTDKTASEEFTALTKLIELINDLKSKIWLSNAQSSKEKVYSAVKTIPKGRVSTYGSIARSVGIKSFRCIGRILNSNPFFPIVPCHRVIYSTGLIGGFAYGIDIKKSLLEEEGIIFTINNRKIKVKNDFIIKKL